MSDFLCSLYVRLFFPVLASHVPVNLRSLPPSRSTSFFFKAGSLAEPGLTESVRLPGQ